MTPQKSLFAIVCLNRLAETTEPGKLPPPARPNGSVVAQPARDLATA